MALRSSPAFGTVVEFDPAELLAILNEVAPTDFVLYPMVRGSYSALGKLLAVSFDELFQTGIGSRGENCPQKRDLTKAPSVKGAIDRFLKHRPVEALIAPNSIRLRFMREPAVSAADLMGLMRQSSSEKNRVAADRILALCCLSGWHLRLAKCCRPSCGVYFWLRHWNRTYKRGAVCPECTRFRSAESALQNISEIRKKAQTELHQVAAKHFGNRIKVDPGWHRDRKLKDGMAKFLNKKIAVSDVMRAGYPHGITGKLLARSANRQAIERMIAKGESDGKGKRA